jgi:hemophore-related protein
MHVRSLLAGAGLAVAAAAVSLVVVSSASADDGAGPITSGVSCPGWEMRRAIDEFLLMHPQVAEERAGIRALPPELRPDAWRQYLTDHPDIAADINALRGQLRGQWWEVAGNVATAVEAQPELAGMFHALADAPPGERRAVGRDYLAEHPEARAALQDLRQDRRTRLQACLTAD